MRKNAMIKPAVAGRNDLASVLEENRRLRALIGNVPDPVCRFDRARRFVYANPACLATLGRTLDDILGRRPDDLGMAMGDWETFQTRLSEVIELRCERRFEFSLRTPNGWRQFDTRLLPECRDGQVDTVLGVARELPQVRAVSRHGSARLQTEKALRLGESALASAAMAVAIADWQGSLVYVNRSFLKMWGYSAPEEVLGKDTLDFWYDKNTAANVIGVVKGTHRWIGELTAQRHDGSTFVTQHGMSAISDDGGKVTHLLSLSVDIMQRVTSATALQRSEERYRSLAQLSVDWYWEQDAEFRFTHLSQRAFERLGEAASGHLGKRLWEVPIVAALDQTWAAHRQLLEAHAPFKDLVVQCQTHQGSLLALSISGQPLFDAAGQFMGYRGVARDMTGEQQWARAVQESEDRFRRLAESVTDVFWFFEVDPRRLIYTSPSFEQVYGYPVQALRDNPDLWLEMIHPDDRPAVDAGFSDWLQRPNAASFDVEYRILRPDGSVRWIHNRGAHRDRTLDGRIQISGIAIDITDRKQLETALRRSEERVRIATEFGGVGTWERDLRTGTIQWSRSVGPIFGLPAQERKLSLEELLAYVHPDDRDRLTQVRQAWFEGKGDYHVEHRIVWPDGTVRWVYQRGNLYRAADGRPVRTSGVVLDITDRKLAEIALRDSEARFRALTSLGSDWVWEQDEELRFTFFSTSSHEQSPDWADTAIGKTRWELPFVDVTQAEWDAHRAILQQQLPFRDFVARLCRDGRIYTLSISGAPMFDDAGRFRGYRGITTDITAREEARRAIEESEDRFRLFAEQTRDVVWIAARGLRQFHYLSPSFEAIWGWPREDLLNDANAWRKHVYPEDLTHLHEVMSRNRDSPECEVEYRIVRPDGDLRWLVSRSSVIASSSGQHLVCGLTEDITERKRTEAALRRSDEFFRQLADNIEQVFWISYPDLSRVLYVSPAYERLFGRPRETIYEDPSSWEQGVHPDDVQRIREFVLRQEAGLPAGTELRVVRPDGSVRWAWAQSTPFVSSSGEHLVAGIVHDVTERKEREEGRVLHAIAQRDALVREVHHRIKNNLQGVVGLLRRLVARNREASPVLALAITQLQSVAIVHGLQAKAPSCRIMLADLLYAIGRTTEGLMNASVENDFDAEAARSASLAEGETVAIALIVNELIVNAVKHSVKSRRRPAVNVTLRGGTDAVTIRIMNQGELPNGFDATGGKGAGTGLGLVRALLPSEGGSLSFTAEAGRVEATLHIHPPVLISL